VLALVVAGATCGPVEKGDDPGEALVAALAHEGLIASIDGIAFLQSPSGLGDTTGIVRAWRRDEPADIYRFEARVTGDGAAVGTPTLYNLTDTPADEGAFELRPPFVVFPVRSSEGIVGVRSLDLRGERRLGEGWSARTRAQNALTNYQQTGRFPGVRSAFWAIDPPTGIEFSLTADGWIEVRHQGKATWVPAEGGHPIGDLPMVQYRPTTKAKPGNLVTWAVDRVRAMPWFGDDRMQMLKAVSFGLLDMYRRTETSMLGDNTVEEVEKDLGEIASRNPPTTFTDPKTGWPPPPIEPFMNRPLEGEGKWIPLGNDPFIRRNPGNPPAFLTTFVRTDRDRSYTRIYITLWDPRQVEMHMMAGSVEPKGASGEAGPGLIPRRPELMERLVAAANGGFQALHGEWGMMGDGVIYLPPKPYAATVAEMRDGNTGFGTWPNDPVVPPTIRSYRQNLTPLVLDGKINPYKRGWWGGTPPGWEDRVHSTRTGICMTDEDFIAYFYGNEIDVMPLAQAMVQARCKYGMHMDMNPGHTGLEFYKVAPAGTLPDLGRRLDKKWEAQGPVPRMDGWEFRARRMIRFMGLMHFPRYIQREARDYFYLTLRSVLPGQKVPVPEGSPEGDGVWRTKGLPQHGFPYAVATTHVHLDAKRPEAKVLLLRLDPKTVRMSSDRDMQTVVSMANANPIPGKPTLWLTEGSAAVSSMRVDGGVPVVSGVDLDGEGRAKVVAAIGVQDQDGMLVYAEVQEGRRPGQDGSLLARLLDSLGCSSRILLNQPLLPTFGEDPGKGDERFERVVHFVRTEAPGARRIFTDTPIVEASEWVPLQRRRIRYFKKRKKKDKDEDDKDEDKDEGAEDGQDE